MGACLARAQQPPPSAVMPRYVLDDPAARLRRLEEVYDIAGGRVIGSGHFGVVRECRRLDGTGGDFFAIKTVRKRRAQYISMLRQEVAILRRTPQAASPHIVRLIDAFEDESTVSLVFTRAHGGELYDVLTDDSTDLMTERAAARLVRRLLRALAGLHGAGIIHRDIKPENILLQHAGETLLTQEPLLIDFGLATALPSSGAPLTKRAGTALYIAPEVLAHSYGAAADIWSLGVVLFVMLARYPPFHGANEEAIFESVRRGQLVFAGLAWGRRSPAARRFVARLLERNASARLTAAAALRDEWIMCEGAPEPATATAALLARLRRFAAARWLKRAALLHTARRLAPCDAAFSLEAWQAWRGPDAGRPATRDDLRRALLLARPALRAADADAEADALVACLGGDLSRDVWVAATAPRLHLLQADAIEAAFDALDRDGDGLLSRADLLAGGAALCDVDGVLEESGAGAAGRVSYAGFIECVTADEPFPL